MSSDGHTLFFYNPGVGDASWLEKDRQMIAFLDSHLPMGTWVLFHRPFGPPCGGYYYKLEFASDPAPVRRKLSELGISESTIAALHFE